MRNASREVLAVKLPASASRGAKATACTRYRAGPSFAAAARTPRRCCSSSCTSSGIMSVRAELRAPAARRARGICRWRRRRPVRRPCACMAWAMPQAIERSVATPTIRARLPESIPISGRLLSAAVRADERDQLLSWADAASALQSCHSSPPGHRTVTCSSRAMP